MYGVHIAKVLAHVGGARISKKCALTFIRIVRVHHAHETEWFSGVSRFFFFFWISFAVWACLLSMLHESGQFQMISKQLQS